MPHLLGLDIGTTSIKAWIYDTAAGRLVAGAAHPTPVARPRPGRAEHDPTALWSATAASIRAALAAAPQAQVAAVAVASMGEAGVALDAAGEPLFPIIAYYDTRADQYVEWWRERLDPHTIHAVCGQILRPPFGVMKLLWLRDNHPVLFARARHWLSVGDYILWQLSGVYATDRSLASRTILLDQRTRGWSMDLLDLAGIPIELLPPVYPGGTLVGSVSAAAAAQTGLRAGTPVATGGHDHLCGALAAGVTAAGQALVSFGTAAAVLVLSAAFHGGGETFAHGLSCYCHVTDDAYIVQGGLSAAGGALAWLAQLLRGTATADDYAALEQEAAASPAGSRGLVWLPHLRGSGTPERDSASRAALVGLRDEHTRGDIWRAMIESLACWARRNIETIAGATGEPIQRLILIGGAARSTLLARVLADVTSRVVVRPDILEASALGAALLAGRAIGIPAAALRPNYQQRDMEPAAQQSARYDQLYREAYLPLYAALQPINRALTRLQ